MKENTSKLNLLQTIQKKIILRKLKQKDFKSYQNIADERLKTDREIMESAWEISPYENYHEFPKFFQKIKFEESSRYNPMVKYLSLNIQEEFFKQGIVVNLSCCSPKIQLKLCTDYPKEITKLDENIQIQIVKHHNELLCYCKKETQEAIINTNNEMIFYASEEVIEELLLNNLNSPLWEIYATYPNQTREKINELLDKIPNKQNSSRQINKTIANFFNSKTEEQIKKRLKIGDIFFEYCNIETQEKIYEILKNIPSTNYYNAHSNDSYKSPTGSYINNIAFSKEFIFKKFKETYGNKQEYEEFIDKFYYSHSSKINKILRIFLNQKSSIVEKVDSRKVINFLKMYVTKKDNEKQSDELEAHYYNEFYNLFKEAYGEKAIKILIQRPGLNFDDIDNPEILCPEILDNFSEGFIHDLLSYDFGEECFYLTKIVKNPEDLKTFKQYYTYISSQIGENAATMKICIKRYKEFREILKNVINKKVTSKQLEKIYEICIFPKNIAKITKIEEIDNIDEKLLNALYVEIGKAKQDKRIIKDLSDDFDINIYSENKMFNYTNPSEIVLSQLNHHELRLLKYLKIINLTFSYNSYELELELNEVKKQNISISTIFFKKYKLLNKIKEIEMKEFKEKIITGREQIEENIKEGKYGIKRIIVDGIEIIDLGIMPVNFAMHDPKMCNTDELNEYQNTIFDEYLTFEGKKGISTISANAEWENSNIFSYKTGIKYIYWNFDNNEIVAFNGNDISDSMVAHTQRIIKSFGNSDLPLKEYKNQNTGAEIAFYRRYRDHKKIKESPRYGGKIIPNAIFIQDITPSNLQIPTKIFGRNIPIICRGKLQTEEDIKRITKMIKNMKEIQVFNQMFSKKVIKKK